MTGAVDPVQDAGGAGVGAGEGAAGRGWQSRPGGREASKVRRLRVLVEEHQRQKATRDSFRIRKGSRRWFGRAGGVAERSLWRRVRDGIVWLAQTPSYEAH